MCSVESGSSLFTSVPKRLALINGTQSVDGACACGSVRRLAVLFHDAIVVGALSTEAIMGSTVPPEGSHSLRGHRSDGRGGLCES